ncbi:hypothetical protein QN277_022885 [Acacia crassicarpa]|uniref:Retrotransposon gag domain-containing protein n=1 Tax=Acacia crassicarpa TaxID=499986 RepID=A0AAE1JFW2_9FABA|nr:hypothetical protein QN277_022885 [Acacia crassicarpa]
MRNSPSANLEPYDPEIDCTYKQRCRKQKRRSQSVGTTSVADIPNDHEREQRERIKMHRDNQDPPPYQPDLDENKAMMEFGIPDLNKLTLAIAPPTINAGHFEIKSVMIQMLNVAGQFGGLPSEDPHLRFKTFLEVCDSFVILSIPPDAIRIKLFPFSLRDKARKWLNNLSTGSITSWEDLGRRFLLYFFPPTRNAQLRKEIASFTQNLEELAHEAWGRFKNLLSRCPQNGLQGWAQVETFYCGLNSKTRAFVDAYANKSLLT